MENSQNSAMSSDDAGDIYSTMDGDYESLVASTKQTLSINLRKEPQSASLLNTLLIDCGRCVNQSLCLVKECLSRSEVCLDNLIKYLCDAGTLLQSLSDFIKMVIEFLPMKCCEVKAYPTETGMIILTVFTHCKDSESIYGSYLVNVERELKELFKNCQELQLTYLMILEKQFEFDMTQVKEREILSEALAINLEISETVQMLDMKTLAVQWKAYISISEKYCNILSDTSIFEDCSQVLCSIIKMKIQSIIEENDPKIVARLLKVTNFLLRTLQKECEIFKHASRKNYASLVDLLFYVNNSKCVHLEMTLDRVQFMHLVVTPSDCLLKYLLLDEVFANTLLNYDIGTLKQENTFLGYALTLASVMECLTSGLKVKTIFTKPKIINCLYKILPQCSSDFCASIQVAINAEHPNKTHGLFEHLLTRTAALAFTFTSEEFCLLERNMIEAVLSTHCASALFSANLWVLLLMARYGNINPHLLFTQIVWLCTMYKKLEKRSMFHISPQKLHLTYTINRLFDLLENDDKLKICKQFRIHDDDNISLWAALGVSNLPNEAKTIAEQVIAEKLKTQFQSLSCGEDVERLTKLMSLAATCAFNSSAIEHITMQAWMKTCRNGQFSIQQVDANTVWFYNYLKALVGLTESLWHKLSSDNGNLVRILHSVTCAIQQCSVEYRLLFMDLLCKIASSNISRSTQIDANFTQAFIRLSEDAEVVRNKLFITLKQYRQDNNMDNVLSSVEHYSLYDIWSKIKDGQDLTACKDIKVDFKYGHKCFESKGIGSSNDKVATLDKVSSGNFGFADDVDSMFEYDNDCNFEEPQPKKVKLDNSEVEDIIKSLESAVDSLTTKKENVSCLDYRNRLRNVCDKLSSLIN